MNEKLELGIILGVLFVLFFMWFMYLLSDKPKGHIEKLNGIECQVVAESYYKIETVPYVFKLQLNDK